jgi:SAM-dependent methyltransferase
MHQKSMQPIASAAFVLFKSGYRLARALNGAGRLPAAAAIVEQSEQLDLTGRVVMEPKILETIADDDRQVFFAYFESSLAHSFWRAQELSLFKRASAAFEPPVIDFGCGDGSFSACLFTNIAYGVDIDKAALSVAGGYGLYGRLLTFEEMRTAIPPASIGEVFSCSALEHTTDLDGCLAEIARLLKPGGRFHFSIPSPGFTKQMIELVDASFAETVNAFMYHRNLLPKTEWERLLGDHDLQVERFDSFQPIAFTRQYFCLNLLGSRGVGQAPGLATARRIFWRAFRSPMLAAVAASIDHPVATGANFFIAGRKS